MPKSGDRRIGLTPGQGLETTIRGCDILNVIERGTKYPGTKKIRNAAAQKDEIGRCLCTIGKISNWHGLKRTVPHQTSARGPKCFDAERFLAWGSQRLAHESERSKGFSTSLVRHLELVGQPVTVHTLGSSEVAE